MPATTVTPPTPASPLDARVLLVTGKGGVGKSTVAAALALAAAAAGRRTLLLDLEGRQTLRHLLATSPDAPPDASPDAWPDARSDARDEPAGALPGEEADDGAWGSQEQELRPGLWGASLRPADVVHDYLEVVHGLRRVQRVLQRTHALDFVASAAPGLRDLLLVGKVYEIEALRPADGRRAYDLVVVDAPPTGRIVPFLRAPEGAGEIVRAGPLRRQAARIQEMLLDPTRTRAVLVTLLEDLPVQETIEAVAALRGLGIAVGPVLANRVAVPRLAPEDRARLADLGAVGVRERATAAGAPLSHRTATLAVRLADAHLDQVALQERLRTRLGATTGQPVHALPALATRARASSGHAPDVEALAAMLLDQLATAPPAHEATG